MAKEMIAMILAGGQGSRLYALTQKLAKPASFSVLLQHLKLPINSKWNTTLWLIKRKSF